MTPLGAHIWISYSPDLRHWGNHKLMLEARRGAWWDANKIGMSPPPIETSRGWLMIYHGVRRTPSSSIYRLGLALFDLEQPEKCLIRGILGCLRLKRNMNVMATSKTWCFLAAIPWQPMAIPSISTMVPPIRALRWRAAVFAVFWPGWTRTAIRNKLTIEGSGKVRLRFGCHKYYGQTHRAAD